MMFADDINLFANKSSAVCLRVWANNDLDINAERFKNNISFLMHHSPAC